MTAFRQLGSLGPLRRLAPAALLAAVAFAAPAMAQKAGSAREMQNDAGGESRTLGRPAGFRLFALGDLGVTGLRMTGQYGFGVTSYGPCSDGFSVQQCGDVQTADGFQFSTFGLDIIAGTPPGDFAKIRATYPDAANATGGGYTALKNDLLFFPAVEIGPSDGQAGRLFSGVTSTDDGSCRDHTSPLSNYTSTGFSLLPGSDCPETWGPQGFDGPRVFADTAFLALKASLANPRDFTFDYWRVSRAIKESSELAGTFSTYGLMSDSYLERLMAFGKVTKKGAELGFTSNPTVTGYPLGLDFRFEAFQYSLPAIRNAAYYQLLVINNSKQVYGGNGVDYDSLYIGLSPGWGRAQGTAVYYVPSRNAIMTTESGASRASPPCNGAVNPGLLPCGGIGFGRGATGVVMLKSPIGDARNKLFTLPGTAFFDPSNKAAGDTITFNHGHMCGFGSCWDQTWAVNDQRAFGLISSTGTNYLQGRAPASLADRNFYRVFRNVDFPTRTPQFNRYIPGNWDYNKDGTPDTLFFDTCHLQGCVKTWADTMPGTTRYTVRGSNIGGTMNAGPVKLRAGDTTAFVFAFIGAPDSASFERLVDAATDAYNTFFLVPKAPPVPTVAFTSVTPADSTDPVVRIGYTTEALTFTDQFVASFANQVRNDPRASFRNLRLLNPNLVSQLDAVAQNGGNLAEILIFKSCDDGRTFTSDADCDNDPLTDQGGSTVGVGFRPYATIRPVAGLIPVFTDANVIGGRTYLYSFVTKSNGFRAIVRDSLNGQIVARELVVVDTTYSPLRRSGPTVAKVYVPLSLTAGGARARATVASASGTRGDVPITFRFADNVAAGTYNLVFGNRVVIRTAVSAATGLRRTTTTVQETIAVQGDANFVRSQVVYTSDAAPTVSAPGATTVTSGTGDSTITTTTVSGATAAVLLDSSNRPLFVSTTLAGATATPAAFGNRTDFPGFLLTLNQANGEALTFERIIEPDGDTLPVNVQNLPNATLNLVEGRTTKRPGVSGNYDFTFQEDAFGPGAPFRNTGVQQLENDVRASLAARPAASRADTSAVIRAAVAAAVPSFASRQFITTSLPFTVRNTTFNRPVTIAVPRRATRADTLRFGAGLDTVSITVPDSVWVPGDTIFLIENVERDSTAGGLVVLDGSSRPIRISTPVVTLGPLVLDCTNAGTPRIACNPLAQGERGAAPGYYDYAPGTRLSVRYQTPFRAGESVTITVDPRRLMATTVTVSDLKKVRVVPNPFVVQSQYNTVSNAGVGDARVIFTGVPAQGSLRVYSLSGQFLQEIVWTEADLNGTGDLPYDLRTREGTDLTSGLYIFVVKGRGQGGGEEMARGKFVVIR